MGFLLRRSWALPEPDGDLEDYGPDDWQIPDMSDQPLRRAQKHAIFALGTNYVPVYGPASGTVPEMSDLVNGFTIGINDGGVIDFNNAAGQRILRVQRTGLKVMAGGVSLTLEPEEIHDGWAIVGVALRWQSGGQWWPFHQIIVVSPHRRDLGMAAAAGEVFIGGTTWVMNEGVGHISFFQSPDFYIGSYVPYPNESMVSAITENAFWDVLTPERVAQSGGIWHRPVNAGQVHVWTVDDDGSVRQVTKPLPRSTPIEFRSNGHTWFGGQRGDLPTDRNAVRAGSSHLDLDGADPQPDRLIGTRNIIANNSGSITELRESAGGPNRPGSRMGRIDRTDFQGPDRMEGQNGTVRSWAVKVGDTVQKGQVLGVVEYREPGTSTPGYAPIGKSVICRYIF